MAGSDPHRNSRRKTLTIRDTAENVTCMVWWGQAVQLKPDPNSLALDVHNATPVN
jgi:hypothetical protein